MAEISSDSPGALAPPPVLYVAFLLLGIGIDYASPLPLPFAAPAPVGGIVLAAGMLLVAICARRFRAAGTNVPTNLPVTALVREGPYRFSRNPIYVGLTAIYLGFALLLDSGWVLVLLVPLLILMRYGVIGREERYLEKKFGDDYRNYKTKVRRWL